MNKKGTAGLRPWLQIVGVTFLGLAVVAVMLLRVWQALEKPSLLLKDQKQVDYQQWRGGSRLLLAESCDELPAGVGLVLQKNALRSLGRGQGLKKVSTAFGNWLLVSYHRDLPVVYQPCRGTYMMTPSALKAQGTP